MYAEFLYLGFIYIVLIYFIQSTALDDSSLYVLIHAICVQFYQIS